MDNNAAFIEKGCLKTEGGIILFCGKEGACGKEEKECRVIDVGGDILMPGLINCHCHLGMSLFRGAGEGLSLQDWLNDNIFPMEKLLTEEDVYYGTMLSVAESVKCGVTTLCDSYFFNGAAAAAAEKSGIKMVLAGAEMDFGKSKNDILKKIEEDCIKYNKGNINYIPGCHSVYTCSQGLIEGIADIAASYKLKTYIHLSETLKEVGDCVNEHNGLTPPQYLHKCGYFSNGGIAAHCVFTDKDDLLLLKQSNVSPVHCPASNLKLGSGIAPVYSMKALGLNVALGTDGSASNNCLDMPREMYIASLMQKGVMNKAEALSSYETLEMATVNGARALGLNNTGKLVKGYRADIIRLGVKEPHMRPICGITPESLIYNIKSEDVVMTMCGGKILYEKGVYYIGEDIEKIYYECEKRSQRLFKGIKNDRKIN
jgi:5-methylthioadenosine/S-adenosylhomocysteine deaminase